MTVLDGAFPSFSKEITGKQITGQNKKLLRHWFTHATVAEAYGLNAEDIAEVENWYARRYPKLSQAQKANLRKLQHLNTD
ncbi:MAG: hypothetical protein ACKPEO_00345 [Sphaerospermopsis kisseleviana]